ncbi:MAG: hypothetical protein M0Z99_02040 [Betaproteobacteria bacterium]|nr:hypothetical protein [Betaproteobacteria bacterium]
MNAPERLQVYAPRPGSLVRRVLAWFMENPEEELTVRDVAIKFGVPYSAVPACLQAPIKRKLLTRSKTKPYVYRPAAQK